MAEKVSQADAAKRLGLTPNAIGQWAVRPGAPVEMAGSRRVLLWPAFPRWRESELRKEGRTDGRPESEKEAIRRKLVADAVMAELNVAQKEGELIAVQVHEAVVGDLCDRLRAVIVNMAGNYLVDLERLGVTPQAGQAVLEKIAADLTGCLRRVADDIETSEPEA